MREMAHKDFLLSADGIKDLIQKACAIVTALGPYALIELLLIALLLLFCRRCRGRQGSAAGANSAPTFSVFKLCMATYRQLLLRPRGSDSFTPVMLPGSCAIRRALAPCPADRPLRIRKPIPLLSSARDSSG
jgi:hypothetical protein